MYTNSMGPMTQTQDKIVHKKRMGRPPGIRYGETIPARFEIETMKRLDAWAKKHGVSRSEALRQLVELGLKVKAK
jgi:Ribbon-helix-helix protein, copG family